LVTDLDKVNGGRAREFVRLFGVPGNLLLFDDARREHE
jgi:hypothetical protein